MAVSQPGYEVFIKSDDALSTKKAIEAKGGTVKIVVGKIITAFIPQPDIEEIAERDEVVFIEAAKPVSMNNDVAMEEINGNEAHEGTVIPTPLTGKNTIVGIVDTGIDYNHADFKDAAGVNRILYVWDQTGKSGAGPTEIEGSYGTECDADDLKSGACQVTDESGHGTHITGTAAGRSNTYGGVAPDASIIIVKYKAELEFNDGYANPVFSTTICEGAYYVFRKAETLGLPAVVNLSLGTHIGPHDGTSLFEECLDSLVEGSKGRAIIVAGGNENSEEDIYTGLHAGYDVAGEAATNFEVRSFQAGKLFYIDIWGARGSDLSFALAAHELASKRSQQTDFAIPGGSKRGTLFKNNVSYEINAGEEASSLNGKPHVGITITIADSVTKPESYNFDLIVSGNGHFDAWLYPDKPASIVNFTTLSGSHYGKLFVPGDRKMSIASPATAKNVIGVAAYTTRNRWDAGASCCQVSYTVGDLLDFSSVGPSADPSVTGQKPEIAAPGAMIASAKSQNAHADSNLVMSDGKHMLMAGTSMAAPFVAGTVALLFSANPDYTFEDIERYVTQSAYVDSFVGTVPNDSWGYGKLDVLGAVEAALNGGASGSSINNPDLSLPAEGSSSCSLAAAASSSQGASIAFIMLGLVTTALFAIRRS